MHPTDLAAQHDEATVRRLFAAALVRLGEYSATNAGQVERIAKLEADNTRLQAVIARYAGVHGVLVDADRAELRAALADTAHTGEHNAPD